MVNNSERLRRSRAAARFGISAVVVILGLACRPFPYTNYPLEAGLGQTLEADAAKTRAYMNTLAWSESPVHLVVPCGTCAQNPIVLDFYLNQGSSSIDLRRIIRDGRPGHLVAKIKNHNNFPYADYGLAANDSVFLWVGRTRTQPAFATFHIDAQGVATGLRRANRGIYCPMPRDPNVPPVHEMPYQGYSCEFPETVYKYGGAPTGVAPDRLVRLASSDRRSVLNAIILFNGDLWFSCSQGCCQADSWALY